MRKFNFLFIFCEFIWVFKAVTTVCSYKIVLFALIYSISQTNASRSTPHRSCVHSTALPAEHAPCVGVADIFPDTGKSTSTGAFHKAGFTYRNLVGRWLAAAVVNDINLIIRREINPRPTTKGVRTICSYSFSHTLPARYSVLHL